MRPIRSSDMFGRGGPMSPSTAAAKLAIALIVGSVITALAGDAGAWLVLVPELVLTRFALWQPLSYIFVETSPFTVLIGAFIIWSIGGSLEASWGPKRVLSFSLGTVAVSGVLTVLLSLVLPVLRAYPFAGGTVLTTVLWVGYGWSMGRLQMGFFGLPITGNTFALIGIGFVGLNAVFARSVLPFLPEVFAIALTALYVKVGSPRLLVLKLRQWKLQRELKSRTRHLNVIRGERDDRRGSDRYIH